MRKLAAAALAVPVIALLYASLFVRRWTGVREPSADAGSAAVGRARPRPRVETRDRHPHARRAPRGRLLARAGVALGLAAILGLGAIGATRPTPTTARPPGPIAALPVASFTTTLAVRQEPDAPVVVAFTGPMDRQSVAASLRIVPPAAVALRWNAAGTLLTVTPREAWTPGALHNVTVAPGALDANGTPITRPARATFLVRPPTAANVAATLPLGETIAADSDFVVSFDRPVDLGEAADAFMITPAVPGTFRIEGRRTPATALRFTPAKPLAADTIYTVTLAGKVHDVDGAPLGEPPSFAVTTAEAPTVVQIAPAHRATGVERASDVTIRFNQPMDRAATAAAFRLTVDGKRVAGSVRWTDGDSVLVFEPKAPFGYAQRVRVELDRTARSKAATVPERATTASFTTNARTSRPPSGRLLTGGSAVGGGTWAAVETFYLRLMNCTRTGGWVTSSGGCSSPGGRDVRPLVLSAGISSRVARPYARLLATRNLCSHFIGGNPGDRLRRAGYDGYSWAENIGCRSGGARAAVLGSHLFFQSEKPYNGGHYRNLMNAAFRQVGIGVWVAGGRVRLVVDFYAG